MLSALNAKRAKGEGFSLVELLVVVVILGVLAAIAIPLFTNQKNKAYKSTAQSDGKAIVDEIIAQLSDKTVTPAGAFTGSTGTLTFPGASGDYTPNGVPANITYRFSSGTTVAGGLSSTAGQFCLAVTNNSQTAYFDQNGLSSTATACDSDTGALS